MIRMRGWQRSQRPRAFSPVVSTLEDRIVQSTGVNLVSVVPNVLTPTNGQKISVSVQGYVTKTNPKEHPVVRFQVVDQYRQYQPSGRVVNLVPVSPTVYRYQVSIPLIASRSSKNGPNAVGRQYNILITSTVPDNASAVYAGVVVPLNPNKPPRPIHILPGI